MSEKKYLEFDFAQHDDITQLVPRLPLQTSENLGWHGILVQNHQQPAWEMPDNRVAQHVIVAIHRQKSIAQTERVLDEKKEQEQISDGYCVIIPANVPHRSSWDRDINFTLLILEPAHLAQVAYETVNSDRVELMPQFAKPDAVISSIGSSLTTELEANGADGQLYAESAATFLAAHLLRHYCTQTQTLRNYSDGLPKYKLKQAIEYINQHLGEELSLETIARQLEMSQYYFCHLFKRSMGVSPYQYVIRQRVERAKKLLKRRELAIVDIALECGFANQTHLTKHFRKVTGITPKNYQRQ